MTYIIKNGLITNTHNAYTVQTNMSFSTMTEQAVTVIIVQRVPARHTSPKRESLGKYK